MYPPDILAISVAFPTNISPDHFHDKCFSPSQHLLETRCRAPGSTHSVAGNKMMLSDIYCVLSDIYVGNEVIRRGFMGVISDPARDTESGAMMIIIIMMSNEKWWDLCAGSGKCVLHVHSLLTVRTRERELMLVLKCLDNSKSTTTCK